MSDYMTPETTGAKNSNACDDRNAFDEHVFAALTALNALMTTREMCMNTKAVAKINRFKQWLLQSQETVNKVFYNN